MINRTAINRTALNPTSAFPASRTSRPLYLLGAALLLLVLQVLSGTSPAFALLVLVLLFLSYYAVIWAGGLESLFGLAILYLLLQHVLISQVAKVYSTGSPQTRRSGGHFGDDRCLRCRHGEASPLGVLLANNGSAGGRRRCSSRKRSRVACFG